MPEAMRRTLVLAALAGCGSSGQGHPSAEPVASARRGPIRRVVVPAQLGDPGVVDRIPWGARVARRGAFRFTLADETSERGDRDIHVADAALDKVWPVIAESAAEVQLVSDDDDARLAIWVARADLAAVAIDDVAVAERPGRGADATHRAELRSGAPVQRGDSSGTHRHVTVGGDVRVLGWIPESALGDVFRVRIEPDGDRLGGSVAAGKLVRARPETTSPPLAVIIRRVPAQLHVGAPAGWRDVTVSTDYVRVRGYIAESDLSREISFEGLGSGRGYGMSHRPQITVPAGACLYAEPDGEVVGVNTEERTRYSGGAAEPGWWEVVVGTDWGLHDLYVRALDPEAKPPELQLESCVEERPASGR